MSTLTVSISPDVVSTIVRNTALSTPGVIALVEPEAERRGWSVRRNSRGVRVKLEHDRALIALRVVASTDVVLQQLSQHLRQNIAEVVEEITGIRVESVDIKIEDVRK